MATSTSQVDVVIAQHYKEYGRPTNTANLLQRVLPHDCRILGHPNESDAFDALVDSRAVLLYPGENSRPCREYLPLSGRVTLLVLDGTWRTVKAMARRVSRVHPTLPRVNISDMLSARDGRAVMHPRAEVKPDGASTAEATALALSALGEDEASAAVMAGLEALNKATAARIGQEYWEMKLADRRRRGLID